MRVLQFDLFTVNVRTWLSGHYSSSSARLSGRFSPVGPVDLTVNGDHEAAVIDDQSDNGHC